MLAAVDFIHSQTALCSPVCWAVALTDLTPAQQFVGGVSWVGPLLFRCDMQGDKESLTPLHDMAASVAREATPNITQMNTKTQASLRNEKVAISFRLVYSFLLLELV